MGVFMYPVSKAFLREYPEVLLDGETGDIDVAFKNLAYSLYSRDLSHKVKSAVETRMRRNEVVKILNEKGVPTPAVCKQGKKRE